MSQRRRAAKQRDDTGGAGLDLGLGGLFKGLSGFLDLLSEMTEQGQSEVTRTGEFKVKGLGDKAQGIYGLTVRTGIGGVPQVEHFGNVRTTAEGPVVVDVREPLVDLFDEGQELVIVAELPGAADQEIQIEINEDILSLETTGERKYAKEVLLPVAVDGSSLGRTFRNGILELRVKKV